MGRSSTPIHAPGSSDLDQLPGLAHQLGHPATEFEQLARVAAVLERFPVTRPRAAAPGAAVQPPAPLPAH
jgi:hypothetical protein